MKRAVLALIAAIIFLSACTGGNIAGTGSESPNAITGTIYNLRADITADLKAVGKVCITLYRIDSLRDSTNRLNMSWYATDSSLTDSSGHFSFEIDTMGQYSVLASYQSLKAFSGIININSLKKSINNLTLELKNTINIDGSLRDTSQTNYSKLKLGIIGTPFITECFSNSSFYFTEVPQGDLQFYASVLSIHSRITNDTTHYYNQPSFPFFSFPVVIQNDTVRTSIGTLPIIYKSTLNP
ncbi:MAG: hypothetical protein JNL74_02730 [Fibrobacteres bacterium]|nr:hypothetical protein [Fibrobacterota bacterium]